LSQEEIKHLPLEKKGELLRDWIKENCKNIKVLALSNAGLTYLPPEIGQLSQLQVLNLYHNQLTSLPAEIGQLPKLQTLELAENPLKDIAKKIRQRFHTNVVASVV
jgi:Leucine-rich repeat (LRR) protein